MRRMSVTEVRSAMARRVREASAQRRRRRWRKENGGRSTAMAALGRGAARLPADAYATLHELPHAARCVPPGNWTLQLLLQIRPHREPSSWTLPAREAATARRHQKYMMPPSRRCSHSAVALGRRSSQPAAALWQQRGVTAALVLPSFSASKGKNRGSRRRQQQQWRQAEQ